jgi:hypothetical protein
MSISIRVFQFTTGCVVERRASSHGKTVETPVPPPEKLYSMLCWEIELRVATKRAILDI